MKTPFMKITLSLSVFTAAFLLPSHFVLIQTPAISSTAAASFAVESPKVSRVSFVVPAVQAADPSVALPSRLIIPSIGLNASIKKMGLNSKGEMDVPSASTKDVGWYAAGTVPGNQGSAVIGAHVFAAFANLKNLKVGQDVYVFTQDGTTLRFVVEEAAIQPIAEISLKKLFARSDAVRLNLITCAGKPTPDGSTYTHRLIVFTRLVK